jgi:hypothetical protein
MRSCHRWIYCVNWLDALNIELYDVRFCVIDCNPEYIGKKAIFDSIATLMKSHAWMLWNYFKKRPIDKDWNKSVPLTAVKQSVIERKYGSHVQFVLQCGTFWGGQQQPASRGSYINSDAMNPPLSVIKWHWDALYGLYREWARASEIECGISQKPDSMILPLQTIGIKEGRDKGRVRIPCSNKSQNGRDKGFEIDRDVLIQNVKDFLSKCSCPDDDWTPPEPIASSTNSQFIDDDSQA